MQPFFADYLERLATLHREIDKVIAALPEPALDWQPGPAMNSVAILVAHVAGSEQFWIGDMTWRGTTQRSRAQEFTTTGLDQAALQTRLASALADSQATLAQLTLADLERACHLQHNGERYTVGWALLHALEHVGTHVGHLQLIQQLWEQRAPASTPAPSQQGSSQ